MPNVRNFKAGEQDRRDELHDMIRAIEDHQEAVEDLVLARDWEPANSDDWAEIRRLISQLGDILHRARWAHMWELCELYRDDVPGLTQSEREEAQEDDRS